MESNGEIRGLDVQTTLSEDEIAQHLDSLRGNGIKIFDFDASAYEFKALKDQQGLPNDLRNLLNRNGLTEQVLIRGIEVHKLAGIAKDFTDHPEFDSVFAYTLEDLQRLTRLRRFRDAWRSFRNATDKKYEYPDEAYVHSPLQYAGFGREPSALLFYDQGSYQNSTLQGGWEQYKRMLKPEVSKRGLLGVCRVTNGRSPQIQSLVQPAPSGNPI